MASLDCATVLSQCIAMVREMTKSEHCATISVRIGQDFDFSFTNQDFTSTKRLSPSQQNRNKMRKINYEKNKGAASPHFDDGEQIMNMKQELKTSFSQTDVIVSSANDMETQTEVVTLKDNAVNTEEQEIVKLDSVLNVDDNGTIQARDGSEKLVERRISHNFKTWEEIKHYVEENLGMNLIGRPWLANNGNHYKTVGFRTKAESYEDWKIRTFNWQESGVRAVSSSRLYR